MVAISAVILGALGTLFSFAVQAVTSTFSLLVGIVQAYFHYFSFIINVTRRDS